MKSLRRKFVTHIVLIFLVILILIFGGFACLMKLFFFNTVVNLDIMENQLAGKDFNVTLSEYKGTTESLAKNANLVDMLANCNTPEAFNSDHNFPLIVESMAWAQTEEQRKSSNLWVYSLEYEYEMLSGEGRARSLNLTDKDREMLGILGEQLYNTIYIEYSMGDGTTMFNVVTPIRQGDTLYGLVGTSMDLATLLESVELKAGINNMVTECSLVIPTLRQDMSTDFYTEYYLKDQVLCKNTLPADYLSTYTDGVKDEIGKIQGLEGKKHISAIGNSGWFLSSFVPDYTVTKAFLSNYGFLSITVYFLITLAVLSVVAILSYRLTKPIHDLDLLVNDIRNNRPYKRLKGNNEVSRAADSLIELVRDNESLLDDIKGLAGRIERGELFTRFKNQEELEIEGETTQHEIKESLNHMLESVTYILDNLPVGVAIIDEDYQIIYINASVRNLVGECQSMEGMVLDDFSQVSEKDRRTIARDIDDCKSGVKGRKGKITVMGRDVAVATARLQYSRQSQEKLVFLQVYLNQTEVIAKIREQEQIFAYFAHLSLLKKEALHSLAKGDFKRATLELGFCPSAPYLREIYNDQVEMKQAFGETVENIESIITQMGEATRAFADGNLHMVIDMENANGKYGELVKTANHAFDIILNYFQSIPVPIRIIDREYKVRFFNDASYKNGFRPGKNIRCYHMYNREEACEGCPYHTGNKEILIRDYNCDKGGKRKYWRIYRNPLLDEDGNIYNMLEILFDETKMVELRKEADSANRAKSIFIANMSHEIRTPMNSILGYSQLLEMSSALSKADQNYVETIKRSGTHLLTLINDILELSKIEAGKITLNEELFQMEPLLEDVESMFASQITAKELSLKIIKTESGYDHMVGDIGKIRQILFNVISNAIKFTEKGGVVLMVSSEESGADRVRLIMDVTDSGCGIAKNQWDKVFNAFEQADAGVRSGAGTGLGMAISRNFAKMMGGSLDILSSAIGKGTTFRIVLELEKGAGELASQADEKSYQCIKGIRTPKTVLVVDAVSDNRELLCKILETMGFGVIAADNNEQAFSCWKEHTPDLLTTDLTDEGGSAMELIRNIRSTEKNMYTPIIAITAYAMEENKEEALKAGVDVFMTKPLTVDKLAREIERLTGVQYIFGDEKKEIVVSLDAQEETLPPEIRDQIIEAVRRGDFDSVTDLAGVIAATHPSLSLKLAEYADDFDKDGIYHLLDSHM